MKNVAFRVIATTAITAMVALLVGCQTSGKLVSLKESTQCPMCKTETRTSPIKGINVTKSICPSCKTVRPAGTFDELADLQEVHVCDHCHAVVATCPTCAKKNK